MHLRLCMKKGDFILSHFNFYFLFVNDFNPPSGVQILTFHWGWGIGSLTYSSK